MGRRVQDRKPSRIHPAPGGIWPPPFPPHHGRRRRWHGRRWRASPGGMSGPDASGPSSGPPLPLSAPWSPTTAGHGSAVPTTRTKDALAVKRSQGVRLGRRPVLNPAVGAGIISAHQAGAGWSEIRRDPNNRGVPTADGGARWYPVTVRSLGAEQPSRLTSNPSWAVRRPSPVKGTVWLVPHGPRAPGHLVRLWFPVLPKSAWVLPWVAPSRRQISLYKNPPYYWVRFRHIFLRELPPLARSVTTSLPATRHEW
jgi:hypothetical protein